MLTAHEMSKDLKSKQKSPNLVVKLMGLDVLPQLESDSPAYTIESKLYSQNSHSEIPLGYWQDERGFFRKKIDCEVHSHGEKNKYEDIYEMQQSHRTSKRDKSPQKRSNDNVSEKMMALIRQKFMEAKRLAMDEKLQQTKEFQDALDFLSSHGDLFLKVLQEPNTVISQHLYLGESIYLSPKTKHITVLGPSKMASDDKLGVLLAKSNEKQVKKQVCLNQVNVWENQRHGFPPCISSWKFSDSPIQPTRIVVLKPSPGKATEPKGGMSSTSSLPRVLTYENIIEEPEDEEAQEAREVAKEITQQMRENLAGHRRDESLLSSVLSNGYTGDDSSFEKFENEFAAENLSDSEVMSPAPRHSWDYVSRYDSPFSSSFSRASYSPESSVCREAKKRLSERWAMMVSNGNNNSLDQQHLRRSSTTLGEMLGLSEIKRSEICEEENDEDQNPRASTSGLNSNMGTRDSSDSPRNLLRSKSVPVSSSAYGELLNVKVASAAHCNVPVSKEILKAKTSKTSFTGKVTSLIFSRYKKFRKEKPSKLPCNDESQLATAEIPGLPAPFASTCNDCLEAVSSPTSKSHDETALTDVNELSLEQGICSPQKGATLLQGENQEQPSPISVLDPPFEEDDSAIVLPNRHAEYMPLCIGKSNLIEKSPSGTIARTLSRDKSFAETDTNYYSNSPFMSPRAEDDEVEYIYLVQSLLTMAGLDEKGEMVSSLARWHSLDSPLDPRTRDKYIDLSAKEPLREAKRHLRSSRKLIFDCVNAALVDITGFGTPASSWGEPCVGHNNRYLTGMELADKVWVWMKELLPGEVKYLSTDGGDNHSLVERLVRNEVVGKGWIEQINLQVDSMGNEIGGKLLEELLEEFVVEWTG